MFLTLGPLDSKQRHASLDLAYPRPTNHRVFQSNWAIPAFFPVAWLALGATTTSIPFHRAITSHKHNLTSNSIHLSRSECDSQGQSRIVPPSRYGALDPGVLSSLSPARCPRLLVEFSVPVAASCPSPTVKPSQGFAQKLSSLFSPRVTGPSFVTKSNLTPLSPTRKYPDMSADTEMTASRPNGVVDEVPSTPPHVYAPSLSQQSIPSTEGPASPIDPNSSFKTELNDDRNPPSSQVIPSSLTPPPSSQVQQTNGAAAQPFGYISSQRASMFSPPATTLNLMRREGGSSSEYAPPTGEQIMDASVEELRTMFQSCLAENARQKMETAHHKLQYNLLSMQSEEDAKRADVEHEMIRREVEVLRVAENSRQARRELTAAAESTQVKYLQLKVCYEAAVEDNEGLRKWVKGAKKLIQQKEDEIISLTDERDMLLNRIRENREHFHMLCSPGGAFHGVLTPKTPAVATPQPYRTTPRQTPKSANHRDHRQENDTNQAGFAALLQALSHDNNSAPSTPTTANRAAPRMPPKHTRGVQSLSSLPTTPMSRPRGEHSVLLPSIDLVPQTEPPPRFGSRFVAESPVQKRGRKSRESTISADDNEELARAALESVAAATQSFMSHSTRGSASRSRRNGEEEEEVFESQASQAASEMLRRDPRESFDEVASSVGSRDGTPAPVEKSAKLQAKLFASVNKPGLASEKRKFSGAPEVEESRREAFTSPTKKMRYAPGGAEASRRVGLGIQYSR